MKKHYLHKKILFVGLILGTLFVLSLPVFAQMEMGAGLEEFGGAVGVTAVPLPVILGRIVRIIIGISGVILVSLIIYAGFIWMTSEGNPEKISKAKKMMTAAVIGLAIMIFSFAITSFILGALEEALGLTGVTIAGGIGDGGGVGGLPRAAFSIKKIVTSHDISGEVRDIDYHKGVYLCSNIQPIFNNFVDANKINNLAASDLRIEKEGAGKINGNWLTRNNVIIFKQSGLLDANTNYSAYLPKAIIDQSGQALKACAAAGGCLETDTYFLWKFKTGETADIILPKVILSSPQGENVPLYTEVNVKFSEPIDATTVIGEDNRLLETNIKIEKKNKQTGATSILEKGFWKAEVDEDGFTLTPEGNNLLEPVTTYTVTIQNIEDLCQNKLAAPFKWQFGTSDVGLPCRVADDCSEKCCLEGTCHRLVDCQCHDTYPVQSSCEDESDGLCCWGGIACYGQGAKECNSYCQNLDQASCLGSCCWGGESCYTQGSDGGKCENFCNQYTKENCGGGKNNCCWGADAKCHSGGITNKQCNLYCSVKIEPVSCNKESTCCWGKTKNKCLVSPNSDCPPQCNSEYPVKCGPSCCSQTQGCKDPQGNKGFGKCDEINCDGPTCGGVCCSGATKCDNGSCPTPQCAVGQTLCGNSCCSGTCLDASQNKCSDNPNCTTPKSWCAGDQICCSQSCVGGKCPSTCTDPVYSVACGLSCCSESETCKNPQGNDGKGLCDDIVCTDGVTCGGVCCHGASICKDSKCPGGEGDLCDTDLKTDGCQPGTCASGFVCGNDCKCTSDIIKYCAGKYSQKENCNNDSVCCWRLKGSGTNCLAKGNPDCTKCDPDQIQCGISCCSQATGCQDFKCPDGRTVTSCQGTKCDPCALPSQTDCGGTCCLQGCNGDSKCASCYGYLKQDNCETDDCCWGIDNKCFAPWIYQKDTETKLKYCPSSQ